MTDFICPICGRNLGLLDPKEAYFCCDHLMFIDNRPQKSLSKWLRKNNKK